MSATETVYVAMVGLAALFVASLPFLPLTFALLATPWAVRAVAWLNGLPARLSPGMTQRAVELAASLAVLLGRLAVLYLVAEAYLKLVLALYRRLPEGPAKAASVALLLLFIAAPTLLRRRRSSPPPPMNRETPRPTGLAPEV